VLVFLINLFIRWSFSLYDLLTAGFEVSTAAGSDGELPARSSDANITIDIAVCS